MIYWCTLYACCHFVVHSGRLVLIGSALEMLGVFAECTPDGCWYLLVHFGWWPLLLGAV